MDFCTGDGKVIMSKTTKAVVGITAMAPDWQGSLHSPLPHTGGGKQLIFRKPLRTQRKFLILLTLNPRAHVFLTFCLMTWEAPMSWILKYDGYHSRKCFVQIELQAELAACFHGTQLLLQTTTERQTIVLQLWLFGRHFWKKKDINRSCKRKKPNSIYC